MQIIVDYRERRSGLVELLRKHCEVGIAHLACGDYKIGNQVLVERKTARDFVLSIADHRFFSQIRRMKNLSYRTLIIIEGDPFNTGLGFAPEAIKGALLSCQVVWQLPVLFTNSIAETAETLVSIGWLAGKCSDTVVLRAGYKPRKLRSRQLYFLQGLPGVGPALAKRLLGHFGTPGDALKATEEELAFVRGVGKKKAALIRKVMDETS